MLSSNEYFYCVCHRISWHSIYMLNYVLKIDLQSFLLHIRLRKMKTIFEENSRWQRLFHFELCWTRCFNVFTFKSTTTEITSIVCFVWFWIRGISFWCFIKYPILSVNTRFNWIKLTKKQWQNQSQNQLNIAKSAK